MKSTPEARTCAHCGTGFTSSDPRKIYCVRTCGQKAYRAKKPKKQRVYKPKSIPATCAICGKDYIAKVAHGKYCGISCYRKANGRQDWKKFKRITLELAVPFPYTDWEVREAQNTKAVLDDNPQMLKGREAVYKRAATIVAAYQKRRKDEMWMHGRQKMERTKALAYYYRRRRQKKDKTNGQESTNNPPAPV